MSKNSPTIIFDGERMKYPNTGIYTFGKELVRALHQESQLRIADFIAYARKKTLDEWGLDIPFKAPFTVIEKHILFNCQQNRIWHTPFQLPRCVPINGKLLLTIHDLNFLYELTPKKQAHQLKKLQKLIDRSYSVVTISNFVKEDIIKNLHVETDKISVIYNGCSLYQGNVEAPAVKPEKKFLFSVGTVLPKKNFHVLPCLLVGNDYELIIAGVRSDYENQIIAEAKKYGVEDRLKIVGTISEAEKHWYYKNCEAFLFPSIAEGFGLPVIEAMYYERPVFLSDHTCLPEIGGKYAFYFNHDFNRELMQKEFAQGMQDFNNNCIYKEGMRNHALSFSWQQAAKKYWDIYEQMLNKEA